MQFSISFDPTSPDLASLTTAEQQAILDTANAAATIWSWYLTASNITLELEIAVDNSLFSGNTLAIGGPDLLPTGNTFGGAAVYDTEAAIELRTGVDSNGSTPDLFVGLTSTSIRSMLFKTDDFATVPTNSIDALSVFLHEIGHGLGFSSLIDDEDAPGVSVYDTFVQNGKFIGASAQAAYLAPGITVPLEPGSEAHVSESALGSDLMSPIANRSTNIHISALDLAILQDVGILIRQATSGDDVMHALAAGGLLLGAGNDIGYALRGGSTINGEDGNDQLYGAGGPDNLYGGNGNDFLGGGAQNDSLDGGLGDDYLEGGGGNDTLFGGPGYDTARYSGLASNYQITRFSSTSAEIKDLRPGSPDGTDSLLGMEQVQWGDGSFTALNRSPVVSTASRTMYSGTTIALSGLMSASDPDGTPITKYQLLDTSTDPSSGHFIVSGVAQPAGSIITIDAFELPYTYFVAGTAGDNLQVRAFDGFSWSAPDAGPWSPFAISVVNAPPLVTTSTITMARGSTRTLSSLFSVTDNEGDGIVKYQLRDGTADPNSGYFVVNGVAKPAGTVIEITAAELAQTFFVAGTSAYDNLQIRAYDGKDWSAADNMDWSPFIVIPVTPPPAVIAPDVTMPTKTEVSLSSLFSVSDPSGLPITRYQIREWSNDSGDYSVIDGLSPSSGNILFNGVAQDWLSVLDISAAELSQVTFRSGTGRGDYIFIRAFNGEVWSSPDIMTAESFKVFLSGPLNRRPEWTLGTRSPGGSFTGPLGLFSAARNQTLATSAFSFAWDADGDPITKYQLLDTTTNPYSGHFVVAGVDQPAGVALDLTPAEWAQTTFVTGRMTDELQMRVFDGKDWSASPFPPYYWLPGDIAWGKLTVTVPANMAPVLTAANILSPQSQILALSSLLSVSDSDGDPIVAYQLIDNTTAATSGYFVVNGVAQPAATVINLSASQLSQASFVAGSTGDSLQIIASDGVSWSNWATFAVTIPDTTSTIAMSGDFGGDGKADLLWHKSDGTILVWQMNASGGLASSTNFGVVDRTLWSIPSVADYNGDGKADVLLRKSDGTVANWLMNGNAIVGANILGIMDSAWSVRGSSDFGGDGKADLLWQKADGTIVVWLMNAGGGLASLSNFGVVDPNLWSIPSVADYNGDGKADVLLRKSDGTIANWLMDGGTIVGSNILGNMDSSWSIRGSGDFGGDGRSDILWQKSDGTVVIWLTNANGGFGSATNFGVVDPGVWSFPSIADYNGDGKADILLRKSDGTIANWLMNGAAIIGSNILGNSGQSAIAAPASTPNDFGGDGVADILWQNPDGTGALWQLNGSGGLSSDTSLGSLAASLISTGDYNGDGKADILLRDTSGVVTNWLMNGTSIADTNNLGTMDSSWSAKGSADFSGDGVADILWQKSDGTVVVWLMSGTGAIASSAKLGVLADWSLSAGGDFNGDGKADILLRNANGNVADWLMDGINIAGSSSLTGMVADWTVKGFGDFGGDGKSDILWQAADGTTKIWQMNGAGAVATSINMGVVDPATWSLAGVADYNGDGKADILLRNANGSVASWLMNGANIIGSNILGTMNSSWTAITR